MGEMPEACQDALTKAGTCSKDNELAAGATEDETCAACGTEMGVVYAECEESFKGSVMELPAFPCFSALPLSGSCRSCWSERVPLLAIRQEARGTEPGRRNLKPVFADSLLSSNRVNCFMHEIARLVVCFFSA